QPEAPRLRHLHDLPALQRDGSATHRDDAAIHGGSRGRVRPLRGCTDAPRADGTGRPAAGTEPDGTARRSRRGAPTMCRIAGIWTLEGRLDAPQGRALVKAMTDAIAYRGPDGEGHWAAPESGIYLGHRRLAIVDLSPAGAQPMASANDRYVTVFNGEIYNHR